MKIELSSSKLLKTIIQPKIDIERYGKQFEYIKSELDEIKLEMKELQQKILDRLDVNEKAIIATILDHSEKKEMEEILDLVKQILAKIQHQKLRGPVTPVDVEDFLKVVMTQDSMGDCKLEATYALTPCIHHARRQLA